MGYYCTVPQCTSLAGKTKNVKFHRFPRDLCMADRWNVILKRGKPFTKYSKVCSLHFTQADYNVTAMGHWKTLSKDAVPSQNLPVLNPDGSVMVIRKSRTVKYKEGKKDDCASDKSAATNGQVLPPAAAQESTQSSVDSHGQNSILLYRLQTQTAPPTTPTIKPVTDKQTTKQDAYMQTDPLPEDEENQESFAEVPEDYQKDYEPTKYEMPKDYTKSTDFLPQTNDEYNKEAEKYALERKSLTLDITYEKPLDGYQKNLYNYNKPEFPRTESYLYQNGFDTAEVLRSQQHSLQAMQDQRVGDPEYFEGQIKEELVDDDKFVVYSHKTKDDGITSYEERLLQQQSLINQVKQEPDIPNGCESVMQPESSPYYQNSNQSNIAAGTYYEQRPGPELLIAKQNALAAHTQLWQNTMKRPFFYTENTPYSGAQLLHRYEDLSRILQ